MLYLCIKIKVMKARYLSKDIKRLAESLNGRILVLTGARQIGKTTISKQLFADYEYLSIEDPIQSQALSMMTAKQWKSLYPKAILDEVQKMPVLIRSIKSVYDQWEEPRYILLGSSQLLLLQKVKESLAGRCVIIDMYPLTLPELCTTSFNDDVVDSPLQKIIKSGDLPDLYPSFVLDSSHSDKMIAWNHLLTFGGYPALVSDDRTDREKYEWLAGYVRTYLERDVRDIAVMSDLEPYTKLQKVLALQTGSLCNVSALSTKVGVSAPTVKKYLQYLSLSYQTITLPSWERNESKRLVKAPKIHFVDYGVVQAILGKQAQPNGNEFESIVVSEIYKQTKQVDSNARFYHLRTSDGREVDLIVEVESGYFAFEVKLTDHVSKTDARHLRELNEILNDKPLLHSFVLSNDIQTCELGDNITAIHAAYFLG